MILPTKSVSPSKALVTVGGDVLSLLENTALSVSSIWSQVSEARRESPTARISYDWFVLAVDMLFTLGAVELTDHGLLRRVSA